MNESFWLPHMTVATIIENNQRFLVVEESIPNRPGTVLNQPAGHIEPNESIFAAAIRETLEETGWHIELTGFLGIYINHDPQNNITYHRSCFIGKALERISTAKLSPEIVNVHWLTHEEIVACKSQHRSILVQRCVDDYLKGQHFALSVIADLR